MHELLLIKIGDIIKSVACHFVEYIKENENIMSDYIIYFHDFINSVECQLIL